MMDQITVASSNVTYSRVSLHSRLKKWARTADWLVRMVMILSMLLGNFTSLVGTARASGPQPHSADAAPAGDAAESGSVADASASVEPPAIAVLKRLFEEAVPLVSLEATPQYIVPGESVTTTWLIDERQIPDYPNGALELAITFPYSFTLQRGHGTYAVIRRRW
jgi:hypothetical protein